ncbi:DUF222 domain-containing protein, partial [Microbacterium sp. HD4P20]|uniref:HNH endonuclease signature motif containing protein n=2 Tax=Microbacterium sp. HD4P20 TaxID=2864874 RepID=UPI0035ABEFD9
YYCWGMADASEIDPSDLWGWEGVPDAAEWMPVPDAVDLVTETATMMSVFAAERLVRIDAMRREMLAEAVGRGVGVLEIVERSIRLELAAAMRVTEYTAGRLLVLAEALTGRYPGVLASLSAGRITEKHAEVFVDLIDEVPTELRGQVVEKAVGLAEAEPVGSFRRALRTLIDTVQARTLEERHRDAVRERRVWVEPGRDGMGTLCVYAPLVEVQAIHGRVTAIAKTITGRRNDRDQHDRDAEDTRALDQVRADVVCDLLIDGTTDTIPAAAHGIRATVVVTVPALALLEDEVAESCDPPVVEGIGPIPLPRARELCGGDGRWMRVLTHPETGMVLSVGRDRYEPPAALRKLVKWRADRCMGPGCTLPASRCEVDHTIRWTDGGDTDLRNLTPLCKGHHIVKDNTDWTVTQIPGSGGAIQWLSPAGRRYIVQPERKIPVFTTPRDHTTHHAPF